MPTPDEMVVENKEQVGRIDPLYILRNLEPPQFGELEGLDQSAAMAEREAAVNLIAGQVAFLAACTAQCCPVSPPWESDLRPPPLVCVVGCGQVGKVILNTLLAMGWPPRLLGACSRNETNLESMRQLGVQCTTDAGSFAQWDQTKVGGKTGNGARLIVLAIPHAQLRGVATDLNRAKSAAGKSGLSLAVVVSVVAGVPYSKLQQLLPNCCSLVRTIVDLRGAEALAEASEQRGIWAHRVQGLQSPNILFDAGQHLALDGHALHISRAFEKLFIATGSSPDEVEMGYCIH